MDDTLESALSLPLGATRTAAIAEWFQSLFEEVSRTPVLVGGSAVELYTGGAYTSADLDFVGTVSDRAEAALRGAGFEQVSRHWVHEEGRVFIELPGATLTEGERVVRLELGGHSVLAISPEDALLDRLAAWKFWRSSVDGAAALLLYRTVRDRLDTDRLQGTAEAKDLADALDRVVEFDGRLAEGQPSPEEIEAWSRASPP